MNQIIFILALSSSISVFANDAITTMADYAQHAMTELAANPPLTLLKNNKGESRHELVAGYIQTKVDDDATLSGNVAVKEKGDAGGFGLGYGYQRSFKDKWAFFLWTQAAQQSGDHTQTQGNVTTATTKDMETVAINLAFGISYEFFRDNENHTLNTFIGPSFQMVEVSGAINTYNSSGVQQSAYDGSFDTIFPSVVAGLMYDYNFSDKIQITPYGIIVFSLADECQTYRVDNVALSSNSISANSPECPGGGTGVIEGETDIAPSFATIGFKFNYKPWDLGFNVSGLIRDAILRSDNEERAEVTGTFFSLSKSW